MFQVLLTHSNHLFADRKQMEKMQPYPPLQTLIVAAVLREQGIGVALFDPTLNPPEEFEDAVARHRPDLVVVCEDDFNFLSKMCLDRNRQTAFQMAGIARGKGIPVAVHGSDASDHVGEYLAAGFFAVILGEPEETFIELCESRPLKAIAGLAIGSPQGIEYSPKRARRDLATLPSPAWDLVEIDRYRSAWQSAHGYFSLNLVSSRGCPYRCNWCAKPIYGHRWSCRPAASVAAEMSYLKRQYKPDHVWFADDIFALSPKWTLDFADSVEHLDAQLPFKMQSRCDLMTRNNVAELYRAGCREVWMGAESGSQRVLDAMDKGIQVWQIREARENLRAHGIRAGFFLQFGYPGEEWSDIEQTIRLVRETAPDDIGISVSYPLPGTKFHQIVSNQLGGQRNWSESGDLAMVFRGAYSSDFYRALADALHTEVRSGKLASPASEAAWGDVERLRLNTSQRVTQCA
jgi:anaerobic magnesium-protoporphyrin IX monomethyl ester cyclase